MNRTPYSHTSDSKLVFDTMEALGIPIHVISSKRTCDAILYGLEDDVNLYKLNSNMYINVAEINAVRPIAVEKNIRSSIAYMISAKTELFHQVFPYKQDSITNQRFLHSIVRYVKGIIESADQNAVG